MANKERSLPHVLTGNGSTGTVQRKSVVCMTVGLLSALATSNGVAQAEVEQGETAVLEEIVVTGTLIRGSAPTGVETIGLTPEAVQATGAVTATQLLQTIPQFGSFNNLQSPVAGFNSVTTNRPNLRSLPGFNTAGSSTTLTLFDGHRIVGMGISSTTPDPDIVPPGALERLEIVPDGGSAIYGSDAVAGVVNFVTRRDIEGVEVDLSGGYADDYDTFDGSISAGHKWDKASAYISYTHSQNSNIEGKDRDYMKYYPTVLDGVPFQVTGITCDPGNLQPTSGPWGPIYALGDQSNLVPNTANQCDPTDHWDLYPKQELDSVLIGGSYDFSDRLRLDLRGFYLQRDTDANRGRNETTQYLGPPSIPIPGLIATPYYSDYAVPGGFAHKVDVAYGPTQKQQLDMDAWGLYPTLTFDLGAGWQVRALASYGESQTTNHVEGTSPNLLLSGIETGLFNPYDPEGSNPEAFQAMLNSETYGRTDQSLFDGSVIVDGDLFSIPGGEVKLAVGGEYLHEQFETRNGVLAVKGTEASGYSGLVIDGKELIPPYGPLPKTHLDRDVKSLFGELVIPIVGDTNALRGMQELTLSASGRYDDYSDFGSTFNPKFGLSYRPVEWVSLRGSWGESFVAPSLADDEAAAPSSSNYANISFLYPPADLQGGNPWPDVMPGQYVIVVLGNAPDIKSQNAETTSFGIDIQPPFVDNLDLNLTWWKIKYDNLISIPNFTSPSTYWSAFGDYITVNPTQEQLDTLNASVQTKVGSCGPSPQCVYAIEDARKNNTGDFKVDGIDVGGSYALETGFGQVYLNLNTTYELNREQSPAPGQPYTNLLSSNVSRFRASTTLGTQIRQLRAEMTLFHTAGYDLDPPVGIDDSQGHVDDYNVVNLFFKYDFQGSGLLEDLALTMNVSNVFDEDPPEYRVQNTILPAESGYANGRTIGRLVQFGVSKKF